MHAELTEIQRESGNTRHHTLVHIFTETFNSKKYAIRWSL